VEHGELRQKPGQPAPGTASDSVMSRDTSDSTFYVYVYVRQDKTRQGWTMHAGKATRGSGLLVLSSRPAWHKNSASISSAIQAT
jgi:hypothetical protein